MQYNLFVGGMDTVAPASVDCAPCKLESVPYNVRLLEASFETVSRQWYNSQTALIAAEAEHGQNSGRVCAEVKTLQDLGTILAGVQRRLDYHSSLPGFSYELVRYDVNHALNYCLQIFLRPWVNVCSLQLYHKSGRHAWQKWPKHLIDRFIQRSSSFVFSCRQQLRADYF